MTKTWIAFVAMLLAAGSAGAASPDPPVELRLKAGVFRPLETIPTAPAWYRHAPVERSPAGRRYLVAITRGPLNGVDRQRLMRAGAEILGYIPVHGYRIRVEPENETTIRALPFVSWLGEFPQHMKTDPGLSARVGGPGRSTKIRVVMNPGEPETRVRELLDDLLLNATPSGKDGAWRFEANIPAGRLGTILSDLSGLPEVEAVEEARPIRRLNQDAVWVHQSFVGPTPQETPIFDQGIFGCGQVIGIADTGQDFDACQFADSVLLTPPIASCTTPPCPVAATDPNQRKDILYYNWSGTPDGDDDTCPGFLGTGHGTHTSGSAGGDRSPYADCAEFTSPGRDPGDGQAPGAKLVIQEMGDGVEYLNNLGGTIWNLAEVAYLSDARIVSYSWGAACHDLFGTCIPGCTLPYDSFARDADLAMWTYPDLLLVTSAGNAGLFCPPPISISSPAQAKNLLTVGSLGHGVNAGTASTFSSLGPVFDGRLKPTVGAQGESVLSAMSDPLTTNTCGTCTLDGSSMSSPTAAGLAALVREYFQEGFHATGTRSPGSGIVPSGALLKATLIDGAVALGAGAPAADFAAGFGRLLLSSTLPFPGSTFRLAIDDHREGVSTGSAVHHAFDVGGGTPLRATLVWTDYPADLNAATARVNELILEAIDPNGNVWFQTLDPGTGLPAQTMNSADPHDAVNVEERLTFINPDPGRWVFRVRGDHVPIDPQPFALVMRGDLTDCPAPAPPDALALITPADNEVSVTWPAVPGASVYNLYRSFGTCPGGPQVLVAAGLTGTTYLDTNVSGGIPYSYFVTAAADATGFCQSATSACDTIVPTGPCTLLPDFTGVKSASTANQATCTVSLEWDPATAVCGIAVVYNIYRSITDGFTPAATNRIARCITGNTFTDSVDLLDGTDYFYVVRAEDDSGSGDGPCRGGNEEGNRVQAATIPAGPLSVDTWTDDAGDTGSADFNTGSPWSIDPTDGDSGPNVYKVPGA
ncbi:MAG: S8 family serine peptidase, partial [Acidobacteriota bacterium]